MADLNTPLRAAIMKLKETDRRPKRQFQPGDIVRLNKSYQHVGRMEGIVLKTEPHPKGQGYQKVWAVFAPKEVDLYRAARSFITSTSYKLAKSAQGLELSNTRLEFVRTAPDKWNKSTTSQEIFTLRFTQILDEDQ